MTHYDMMTIVDCIIRNGDAKAILELTDLDIMDVTTDDIEVFLEKLADYLGGKIGGGVFDE